MRTIDIAVMRVGADGVARFSFGRTPQLVSGLTRVAQHYLVALLTRAGSIFTAKSYGGSLLDEIPSNVESATALHSAVAAAVNKARKDVMVEQARHPMEPADKLAQVNVLEARWAPDQRTYFLRLEIVTESGDSEIISL